MKFNTKLLKKLLLLSATSVSIFSACSAKEDGDYKPYKKQDSIEVAKVEEEKSNPLRSKRRSPIRLRLKRVQKNLRRKKKGTTSG